MDDAEKDRHWFRREADGDYLSVWWWGFAGGNPGHFFIRCAAVPGDPSSVGTAVADDVYLRPLPLVDRADVPPEWLMPLETRPDVWAYYHPEVR